MYYEYFGFKQPPFKITPDTSLFYPGGDRGAILDALLYAILNGEGIVKVVGEVGSGKTMLCRMLEKELPERVEVVYLVNPSISPENTLHAIAFELKLGIHSTTSRFEVMNELQQYLLQRHSENRQVVVFVEEAQSMPIATLEEIRLLSNLETQQSKLLQIVLFGQPELDEMISRPEIRQLKERITYSFQLTPFKINDIREYINSRVRACGYRSGELFSDAAIKQIEHYSKGLLRRINILADKSLLAAFADNSHAVTIKHTRLAVRDSEFVPRSFWSTRTIILASWATILAAIVAMYLLLPFQYGILGSSEQGPVTTGMATQVAGEDSPTEPLLLPTEPTLVISADVQQEIVVADPGKNNEQIPVKSAAIDVTLGKVPIASEPDGVQISGTKEVPADAQIATLTTSVPADSIIMGATAPDNTEVSATELKTVLSENLEEDNESKQNLKEDSAVLSPVELSNTTQEPPENQLLGLSPI